MSLLWEKMPLTQQLARALRASTRRHPSIDGHTFGFSDLKELWCADEVHALCTHAHDPAWQYYFQTPEVGWQLVSVHATRKEAADAAQANVAPEGGPVPAPGTYVTAHFPGGRPMRVQVLSKHGQSLLTEIFSRLGCETGLDHVTEEAA